MENRNVGANRSGSFQAPHIQALFEEPIKRSDIESHRVYYTLKRLGPGGYNQLITRDNLGCREGTSTYPNDLALTGLAPEFGREHKQYIKKALTHWGFLSVEVHRNLVRPPFGEQDLQTTRDWLTKNHPKIIEGPREGQQLAYKILRGMGAKKIIGHEGLPEHLSQTFASSTCRAGASAENSVVDSDLECHDIDNLFICDGGVPPCQGISHTSMPATLAANYSWRRIVAKHFSRV